MRILLIDDDDEILERLTGALSDLDLEWTRAATKEEGVLALETASFDLIVCDLKMPPDAISSELAFEHGIDAAEHARSLAPGTPVLIYSGFRKEAEFESLVSGAHAANLYGVGEVATVRSYDKTKPDLLYQAIRFHYQGLSDLANSVDVAPLGTSDSGLNEYEKRIVRIYSRSRGGTLARVSPMDGGRSEARTLRLEVVGADGRTRARVVAKLNRLSQVTREAERFDEHIAGRLGAGSYADSTRHIVAGAGARGGTFYSFASAYPKSLFHVLAEDVGEAASVVAKLADALEPWAATRVGVQEALKEVCDELCPPERWSRLPDEVPDFQDVFELGITLWRSSSHNDLHGSNVLVGSDGGPLLIDFGDTGIAPALLDPLTLELSAVLHPDSPFRHDGWPTAEQASVWSELERWLEGCPYAEYVRGCRVWQTSSTRGTRDRDAVLLGYSLRQLTHEASRSDVLLALAQGALTRLRAS